MKIIIFLILISFSAFSQKLHYYDSRNILIDEGKTPNYIIENYFNNIPTYQFTGFSKDLKYNKVTKKGILAIFFKLFTKEPLFIIAENTTVEDISEAVNQFSLSQMLTSNQFFYEVDNTLKNNFLTASYLLENLGKPQGIVQKNNETIFNYSTYKIIFYMNNYVVTEYRKL